MRPLLLCWCPVNTTVAGLTHHDITVPTCHFNPLEFNPSIAIRLFLYEFPPPSPFPFFLFLSLSSFFSPCSCFIDTLSIDLVKAGLFDSRKKVPLSFLNLSTELSNHVLSPSTDNRHHGLHRSRPIGHQHHPSSRGMSLIVLLSLCFSSRSLSTPLFRLPTRLWCL